MIKTRITLINQLGLHARASARFVSTACKYLSRIDVTHGNQTVNGKSIMGVMMLAASKNSELTWIIEGPDEEELNEALTALIHQRFGEAE